jgi:hypothetical protein
MGSASPVLLLPSSVCKVFEVVGVDLPIRVSLTSGAGVMVVSSDIIGAIPAVTFVSFNTIVPVGTPICANAG